MSAGLGPRRDRAIRNAMMRIRASAASKIHSQRSDDPVLLVAVASGLAAAAGLCPAGRLGRFTLGGVLTTLLMVPLHPVTSKPATRVAPVRTTQLARRRIRAARASLGKECPASTR
jgi:hypothetical protein